MTVKSFKFEGSPLQTKVTVSYLENANEGQAIGPHSTPVHLDVLEPLDVGLRVAEHLAHKLHVAANHRRAVSRQPRVQDGPVRGALCGEWRTSREVKRETQSKTISRNPIGPLERCSLKWMVLDVLVQHALPSTHSVAVVVLAKALVSLVKVVKKE